MQFQFLELRHSHSQCIADVAQPGSPGLFWGSSNLLKEVPTKWVIASANGTVWLSDQLWNEMAIPDGREEVRDIPERLISIHLFQL